MHRRSFLKRAAIGGAIAWTAPVILSRPAGAQGSCLNSTVEWGTWSGAIDGLNAGSFNVAPVGLSNTDLNVAFSTAGMVTGSATALFEAPASPLGAQPTLGDPLSDFIELGLSGQAAGDYCELIFTFSQPVTGLSFTLLDIDRSIGAWLDQVTLFATVGGVPVVLGAGDYTLDTNFVTHSSPPDADAFTGVAEADNNSTNANVDVTYLGQLDTLIVRYTALAEADPLQDQQIGITGFTTCAP